MDGVTSVETSLILRVAKFSYEWEIPIDGLGQAAISR
jgi:hypothetical protein